MWRILATGKREYRRLVDRRPHDLQLSLALDVAGPVAPMAVGGIG
jgi:hypothetical protein